MDVFTGLRLNVTVSGSTHILCSSDHPTEATMAMTVRTWRPRHHTGLRLLVNDVMVEFLSEDLKIRAAFARMDFHEEGEPATSVLPVVRGTSRSCRRGKVCPGCC